MLGYGRHHISLKHKLFVREIGKQKENTSPVYILSYKQKKMSANIFYHTYVSMEFVKRMEHIKSVHINDGCVYSQLAP